MNAHRVSGMYALIRWSSAGKQVNAGVQSMQRLSQGRHAGADLQKAAIIVRHAPLDAVHCGLHAADHLFSSQGLWLIPSRSLYNKEQTSVLPLLACTASFKHMRVIWNWMVT